METNEAKIIKACQQGDLEKFGQLYDCYIEKIYNFIYYKTMHKQTAEDLVSLSFSKALKNIKKYDPCFGSWSSWLYKIARNTVIDYYRSSKDTKDIESIWDLADKNNMEKNIDEKEKIKEVEKYLKNLKKEQREIIIMRVWDELSYQKIAQITGKSEASLKMMFARTIKKLRQEMPLELFILLLLKW